MKKYIWPIVLWIAFALVAFTLYLTKDNLFYLFNFTYIGTALALGMTMLIQRRNYARHLVQLLVGGYMLGYLGLYCRENMQIEGFWFYLFSGTFEAATIHYAVAKIFGPLLFGRGWCGYACWTAMLLDILPFRYPNRNGVQKRKNIGFLRYILFALSLLLVITMFRLPFTGEQRLHIMFLAFIFGNLFYYLAGILLAFRLKDNRAFCKYLCPVSVFLKPMSYFSLMRVTCDDTKCIRCDQCRRVCPMEVDMRDPKRNRKYGTECIQCRECISACPRGALK